MKIHILATYILLLSIANSQNETSERCRAIYDPPKVYALDVCTGNNMLGVVIHETYHCALDHSGVEQMYRAIWWTDDQCSGDPDETARVPSNDEQEALCTGIANCPYATVRIYYPSIIDCDSTEWVDRMFIVDVCQQTNNGSEIWECDGDIGITRKIYTGSNCDSAASNETVIFPANDTCVSNTDGLPSKFVSCHTRSNATSPIPSPTAPTTAAPTTAAPTTAAPTINGSVAPTRAPTSPPQQEADDAWFITAIVFICLFGVMLCGMIWLGYMVYNDKPRAPSQYDRVGTTEQQGAGVEATTQQ